MGNDLIPRLETNIPQSLDFQPLEEGRYPCFNLALEAAKQGGTYAAVLSAADEVAVHAFLNGEIGFTDIYRVVERVLSEHQVQPGREVEELLEAEGWARQRATSIVEG